LVALKGRNVAAFALNKSVAYSYFFDKALKMSRRMPTAGFLRLLAKHFAQPAQGSSAAQNICSKELILKGNEGEKAGASNKPGSVIDNHSSGIAVTSYL